MTDSVKSDRIWRSVLKALPLASIAQCQSDSVLPNRSNPNPNPIPIPIPNRIARGIYACRGRDRVRDRARTHGLGLGLGLAWSGASERVRFNLDSFGAAGYSILWIPKCVPAITGID